MSAADADRLKRHREEMQRAVADGISLAEARDRLARDRHRAAQSLLEARQAGLPAPRFRAPLPEQWWQR
jgi:hypothetical protein